MKILMVSMFSSHFFNWTRQLKNAGHEVYWFDVFDSNTRLKKIDFVHQITGWRYKYDYPGRHFIKSKLPFLYKFLKPFSERELADVFERELLKIEPDVVQSFALQPAGFPILEVMKKYSDIKWILSAWGNDLYYRQQTGKKDLDKIHQTLPEIDFLFTDCNRDMGVARNLGFKGIEMGVFPGGGGYDLDYYSKFRRPFSERNIILIKGYESHLGRCNKILESILKLKALLEGYEIVIFGANQKVLAYVKEHKLDKWNNFKCLQKIPNEEVLKYMGRSILYIGNSISDGMPNTLLEAVVMSVFPIQSNPGGATEEIITHGKNGLLITDPENSAEIGDLIQQAINSPSMLKLGIEYNNQYTRPNLDRESVREKVLAKYEEIKDNLAH